MDDFTIDSTGLTRRRLLLGILGAGLGVVLADASFARAAANSPTYFVGGLDPRTPDDPQNTDVMMLARVNLDPGTVRALSIPRDLYAEIPGYEWNKINRAFDFGVKADPDRDWSSGSALVTSTIATNFGIALDGAATADFAGFPRIIDAIGGIDVDNPYDLYDVDATTIAFPAGRIHLDGEDALAYVRSRHQDGDNGRVMRQQLVLEAVLVRAQSPEVRDRLPSLLRATQGAVQTNVGFRDQLTLLDFASALTEDQVTLGTMTEYLTEDMTDTGMWIYRADWSTLPAWVRAWLAGDA